jgi:hypothetical protein
MNQTAAPTQVLTGVLDSTFSKIPAWIKNPSKTEFFTVAIGGPILAGFLPHSSIGDLLVLVAITLWASSIIYIRVRLGIWKTENIVFGRDNSPKTIVLYAGATALGLLVLSGYGDIWSIRTDFDPWKYVAYSVGGTAMQEFLYRVYLLSLGAVLFPKWLNITLNIGLFAFMHWFFPNPHVVLSATILGGGLFTTVYFLRPNWVLIWFVHGIMTFTAINGRIF